MIRCRPDRPDKKVGLTIFIGHEIAAHTITHGRNLNWQDEVVQQREIMHEFARVPSNQVRPIISCLS
jgi:hypothetical protein